MRRRYGCLIMRTMTRERARRTRALARLQSERRRVDKASEDRKGQREQDREDARGKLQFNTALVAAGAVLVGALVGVGASAIPALINKDAEAAQSKFDFLREQQMSAGTEFISIHNGLTAKEDRYSNTFSGLPSRDSVQQDLDAETTKLSSVSSRMRLVASTQTWQLAKEVEVSHWGLKYALLEFMPFKDSHVPADQYGKWFKAYLDERSKLDLKFLQFVTSARADLGAF